MLASAYSPKVRLNRGVEWLILVITFGVFSVLARSYLTPSVQVSASPAVRKPCAIHGVTVGMTKAEVVARIGESTLDAGFIMEFKVDGDRLMNVHFDGQDRVTQVQGFQLESAGETVKTGSDHESLFKQIGQPTGATRYNSKSPVILVDLPTVPTVRAMFFVEDGAIQDRATSFLMGKDGELESVPHHPVDLQSLHFIPAK